MKIVTMDDADHHVLLQTAAEVIFPLNKADKQFIEEFTSFFYQLDEEFGTAGLAATQVGKSLRLIIFHVPEFYAAFRTNVYDKLLPAVYLNPRYEPVMEEGMFKDWEGCFSIPNFVAEVYRYNAVEFSWQDMQGNHHSRIAKGFLAKLIQHEVGHLNGEVFTQLGREDCRVMPISEYRTMRERQRSQAT